MSNILLLDDDAALSRVLAEFLLGLGHTVHEVSTSEDALRIVNSGAVRIALVDLFLPDSDGLQVIEQVKISAPKLKVIAMSAGSKIESETCLRVAREIGADASLAKPFSLDELQRVISLMEK